ncbi:MAG: hypothetical protein KGI45_02930 [Patescibacteria group bacterium]|nr:hypothetical protein [Patescibacteria group bacterium]MDE1966999.1 hypothetical protein [Patescibacteria group bacterium]
MVQLPPELSEEHVRTQFKKGDILRWESYPGKIEVKDRFFVLLTSCSESDDVLAVTATKKVSLYMDADGKRKFRDFLFVPAGDSQCFEKDTVIDLNWIEKFTIAEIIKLLGAGIRRVGSLSAEQLIKLDERVSASKLIAEDIKTKILQ